MATDTMIPTPAPAATDAVSPAAGIEAAGIEPIGGPARVAWREGTLTRAKELQALADWVDARHHCAENGVLRSAIRSHLSAAREAATSKRRLSHGGPLMERAASNLDAAEAHILNIAPAEYVLGQIPCLLRHVQCHLAATDPGRLEFERIARSVGVGGDIEHRPAPGDGPSPSEQIDQNRGKIVTTVRAASSAALREQIRLRSFRNVVVVTTLVMALLAIGVAILGLTDRSLIPLCFAPSESSTVVCPTGSSPIGASADIDDVVARTASPRDLMVVELVGLIAAAVAAAAAIRRIRGSSERYGLPVALAALKLPTGAITAFLGLLLMRGQFVPGLSALDTSAQILAWALVFGYAQQLFTRLVDQQGQSVLNSVRVPDTPKS